MSLFIRGSVLRRAKSTATPSNPITDGAANFTVRQPPPLPPPLHSIYSGTRQPAIIFSRRVPAVVAAIPQSAYRTFMRPFERTRVRLHAICDRETGGNTKMRRTCMTATCATAGTRAYRYVIDEHAFTDRPGISNSIYILNTKATKKNHSVGNTRPNEAESDRAAKPTGIMFTQRDEIDYCR